MEIINLISFKLKKNHLLLGLDPAIEMESVKVRLIERTTKISSDYECSINQVDGENTLSLDLNTVQFSNNERNILDVFIVTNDEVLSRPKMKQLPSDQIESRYLSDSFKIDYKTSAIPYLTKDNELSILHGDSLKITKAFAKSFSSKVSASNLHFSGPAVTISLPRSINEELDFDNFYVTVVDRKNKDYSIILAYDVISTSNDTIQLNIQLDTKFSAGHRYDFFVEQKIQHSIIKRRIGIPYLGQGSNQQVFYTPIEVSFHTSIIPYLTTNGELSLWIYHAINTLLFNGLEIDLENNVTIELSKDNIEKVSTNQVSFYLKNTQQGDEVIPFEGSILQEERKLKLSFKSIVDKLRETNSIENYVLLIKLHAPSSQEEIIISIDDESMEDTIVFGMVYEFKLETAWVAEATQRMYHPLPLENDRIIVPYLTNKNSIEFHVGTKESTQLMTSEKITVTFELEDIKFEQHRVRLLVNQLTQQKADTIHLYFKERGAKEGYPCTAYIDQEGYVTCDLKEFIHVNSTNQSRWDLFLEAKQGNLIRRGNIGLLHHRLMLKHERYLPGIKVSDITNEDSSLQNNVLAFYFTNKNLLSCVLKSSDKLATEKYTSRIKLTKFSMEKNFIHIGVNLSIEDCADISINGLRLKQRGQGEALEYQINHFQTQPQEKGVFVEASINVNEFELQPFYWDLYVIVTIGDEELPVRVKNPTFEIKKDINKHLIKNQYNFTDGHIIYPYITADQSLAFTYRPEEKYESNWYKIKENLAYYVYRLFKGYFDKKEIWLGFEKFSETAQDNGYYFFKYCYDHHKHDQFYYVIDKDSKDIASLKNEKNRVLKLKSFKHMVYTYAAKLFIASELKVHSVNIRVQKGRLKYALDRKKIVFLQHGVFGLKQAHKGGLNKKKTNAVDLFVVSSDYEKKIIKDYFNYNNNEIIVTGLARWDVLEDKSQNIDRKEIFVMPTWRTWLEGLSREDFLETEYFKKYIGLFNSERLQNLLLEHNLQLNFFIHPKFKEYIANFSITHPNITIYQFGDIKVNQKLMESSMLITDYSSISWDMFYMNKPVLFYQFDIDEYNQYEGSYMDMETELFGDRAFTVETMVDLVDEYIKRDFKEKEIFEPYREKHFKYHDRNNSERIYQEIMKHKKKLYKK
jgi:CDP-glycerol glycerophosphotransferase (TagB/SpsB family)